MNTPRNNLMAMIVADKVTLMTQLAAANSALDSIDAVLGNEDLDDETVRATLPVITARLRAMLGGA